VSELPTLISLSIKFLLDYLNFLMENNKKFCLDKLVSPSYFCIIAL